MEDVALAVRLRGIELWIRARRQTENLAARAAQAELVGVVDGVARLMAQDAHAPFMLAAFDLEHLRFLQPLEPGMRQVEGDGDSRGTVRGEPLLRDVKMQREAKAAVVELGPKLSDTIGEGAFDGQRQL